MPFGALFRISLSESETGYISEFAQNNEFTEPLQYAAAARVRRSVDQRYVDVITCMYMIDNHAFANHRQIKNSYCST